MPKTLAEIAIDAGLVTKTGAAKAGKMAEERKLPLVVVLVRDLRVDEVALVAALRKQTRVPLIDPVDVQIDPDALRSVPREMCARLRVLPLAIASEGTTRVMRLAMADPTDTAAVAEIEQLLGYEIDVSTLPLSAIEELVDRGYRQINTAVVSRPGVPTKTMFVTSRGKLPAVNAEETSVTAQIPLDQLQAPLNAELQVAALVHLLVAKGIITEAEYTEALKNLK
ncbi:MAG: hypothetical protein WKG01_27115 [Kofleriaceae bacterium]